jgi:hypothetical protein
MTGIAAANQLILAGSELPYLFQSMTSSSAFITRFKQKAASGSGGAFYKEVVARGYAILKKTNCPTLRVDAKFSSRERVVFSATKFL